MKKSRYISVVCIALAAWATSAQGMAPDPMEARPEENQKIYSQQVECSKKASSRWAPLEEQFCERLHPLKQEHAFYPGFDLPPSELHVSKEQILKDRYWPPQGDADWAIVREFNLKAAGLWERILACSADPEAARASYFKGKFCGTDLEKDKAIRQELSDLHIRLLAFLSTSEIPVNQYRTLGNEFHPLFTQAVLEVHATAKHFIRRSYYNDCDRWGLCWNPPWKSKWHFDPESRREYVENVMHTYFQRNNETLKNANDGDRDSIFRLPNNTTALLSYVPRDQCNQWGLWPAVSRVIVNFRGTYEAPGDRYPTEDIKNNITSACGDYSRNHVYNPHPLYKQIFFDQFSGLLKQYLETEQ